MKTRIAALLLALSASTCFAQTGDAAIVTHAREGLAHTVAYMRTQPALFVKREPKPPRVLSPDQRRELRDLWASFQDRMLMLDNVSRRQAEAALSGKSASERAQALALHHAALVSRYRHALDFIALTDADPTLRLVLDEPVPELGLPGGSYGQFKLRYLNALIAGEFASLSARRQQLPATDLPTPLTTAARDDERAIWRAGRGNGLINTLRNAGHITQDVGFKLIFPVQKGVSEWMGDTRVAQGERFLVRPAQIDKLASQLRPGDVLLVRREWYLSNVGLPGFWPHAALYVGTPEQRATWFATPEVRAWLVAQGVADGQLDSLLKARYPRAYAQWFEKDAHGDLPRVIEAISEGVSATSLPHAAGGDSVVVLRPRLAPLDVAQALVSALGYQGRPYDFNFDFRTDDTLVCTEFVVKAYATQTGKRGLQLPLRPVAGRPVTTANDIARHFDETYGSAAQQFDFIAFLDGDAQKGEAVEADLARFRESWKRPKWHIVTQGMTASR